METDSFLIDFINYFNLCNLRNLWIKHLFGCGSAALGPLSLSGEKYYEINRQFWVP